MELINVISFNELLRFAEEKFGMTLTQAHNALCDSEIVHGTFSIELDKPEDYSYTPGGEILTAFMLSHNIDQVYIKHKMAE